MSHLKKQFALAVDKRELATILAALRFHQDENLQNRSDIPDEAIKDIATDCGSLKPLNFNGVNRLCERINSCYETPTGRNKKDWVLIVTDRGAVVHVRAYGAKTAMKKGLFRYLRECCGYNGRQNMEAVSEWIEESGERLGIDIVQQDIRGKSD